MGSKAEEHKGILKLEYPMEHGIVKNWNDMEKIWSYIYSRDNLNVNSEHHAVIRACLYSACLSTLYRFC